MIFDVLPDVGFAPTWAEAKSIVNRTPRYHIAREKPDAVKVIENIHRVGGYTILAHPLLIPDNVFTNGISLSREQFIDKLLAVGLDGIEIRYPYHQTSYTGTLTDQQAEEYVTQKYAERVRMISAGSDYHAEHKTNTTNPRLLGQCGLTWDEFSVNPYWQKLL